MRANTKITEFALDKVVPVAVYAFLAIVIGTFAIDILQTEQPAALQPVQPLSPDDQYAIAERLVQQGNFGEALETYSEIIRGDIAGSEEKAWHEKGKLLVRLQYCNDAINHYDVYVDRFPDSRRGAEGYQLAKKC